ncbi:hypothetical protein ACTQ6A_14495 [Lachnospiraceae bacterium LCP25S3_G4]
MSNILKVTNASQGRENNIKSNPYTTVEKPIPNAVDPSKIPRADIKDDAGHNQTGNNGINLKSNYEAFVKMLNQSPKLSEIFAELLFDGMSNMLEAGIGEVFANEMDRFFEMMKMTEGEALAFMKGQTSGAVKFQGAFFELLRQIMNETTSVDLKAGILEFVKKYNDMASSRHILSNIESNIEQMKDYMFPAERQKLEEYASQLDYKAAPGENQKNLQVLKENIIPLLADYISKTHDMGRLRDIIGVLTLNITRYENSNQEGVAQAFQRLLNYQTFSRRFQGVDTEQILNVLLSPDFEKIAGKSEWADNFLNIVRLGMRGEAGLENKPTFEQVMNALLLNESVYMPLLHVVVPLELHGTMLFSEMWIDPDAQGGEKRSKEERVIKMLITFEIKQIGNFDVIIEYYDGKANIQVSYPEKLAPLEKTITKGIQTIVMENPIQFETLLLDHSEKKKTLSEVFPKLIERKNVVNVRI